MDIVIVANFCGELGQDNNRFAYLAALLAREHRVELITSDYNHGRKAFRPGVPQGTEYKITLLHESGYPRNICLRRFASHRAWGKQVAAYLAARETPDVVCCAVPSLTGPLAAAKYCEKKGIRFVVDVQDLWPEAFQMVLNVPVVSAVLFAPFKRLAEQIYARADAVCAVSRTYVQRVLRSNKKGAKGHCVFLGTRLEDFDRGAARYAVSDKPEGELWLGYCGTLGASYDLTCVFDALAMLKGGGKTTPKFVVMGDGPRRGEFEDYAAKLGLDVRFTGMLPYAQMCGLLCACDFTVNPITAGAAGSIINKHADYAACGKPVLNTQESLEYRELVEEYRMGFNCRNADAEDLADKLERLMRDETLRREMGENARRCAQERFDRAQVYRTLVDVITARD